MRQDDSLRNMLYSLARFGLYFLINIFAVVITRIVILGVVGTMIPKLQLYYNQALQSGICFVISALFLIALFADDAKRHTAYVRYNPTLVSIVVIITSAVYYVPCLVLEQVENKAGESAINNLYFGFIWIREVFASIGKWLSGGKMPKLLDLQVYGILGIILLLAISIGTYILARKIYLRKFESGEYEYEVEEY